MVAVPGRKVSSIGEQPCTSPPARRRKRTRSPTMTKPLRLLLIEDSERDAAHVMLELRRSGWAPAPRRVETHEEMIAALDDGAWDAIVCDFHLPRFSAPEALAVVK